MAIVTIASFAFSWDFSTQAGELRMSDSTGTPIYTVPVATLTDVEKLQVILSQFDEVSYDSTNELLVFGGVSPGQRFRVHTESVQAGN